MTAYVNHRNLDKITMYTYFIIKFVPRVHEIDVNNRITIIPYVQKCRINPANEKPKSVEQTFRYFKFCADMEVPYWTINQVLRNN